MTFAIIVLLQALEESARCHCTSRLQSPVTFLRKRNHTRKITSGPRDFLRRVCRRWHPFTRASEPNTAPHVAGCHTARHPLIYSLIYPCSCHRESEIIKTKTDVLCGCCSVLPACDDTLEEEEEEEEGVAMELLMCDKDRELTSHQTLMWWDVSTWIQNDPVARVLGRRTNGKVRLLESDAAGWIFVCLLVCLNILITCKLQSPSKLND